MYLKTKHLKSKYSFLNGQQNPTKVHIPTMCQSESYTLYCHKTTI